MASPAALTTVANYQGQAQAITGTLTISAGQTVAALNYSEKLRNSRIAAAGLFYLPALLLGVLLAVRRKRLRSSKLTLCLLMMLALIATVSGTTACGGGSSPGSSNIPTGTTQITVTGSGTGSPGSGDVAQSVGLTLTIERSADYVR
jgi:hypothetical protein